MRRIKLTGEVPPAEEKQTLSTHISLRNLFRIEEVCDLAKIRGKRDATTMEGVLNIALNQFFESLPEGEQDVINANADAKIDFAIQQEQRRTTPS